MTYWAFYVYNEFLSQINATSNMNACEVYDDFSYTESWKQEDIYVEMEENKPLRLYFLK